jgi:amino-acid N-acetyltransferase
MKKKSPQLVLDDILKYIPKFQGKNFVLFLSGHILEKANVNELIRQISLLFSLGIKIILVHGARPQITKIANKHKLAFEEIKGKRITTDKLLILARQTVMELSQKLLEHLTNIDETGIKIKPVIGNFIKAKALGIIDGTDFEHTGQVDKINKKSLTSLLDQGYMPIISSLGIDAYGELFNIRAVEVATQVAIQLKSAKILYIIEEDLSWISQQLDPKFTSKFQENSDSINSSLGELDPARLLKIIKGLKKEDRIDSLQEIRLINGYEASKSGVERVHFINGLQNNAILNEIFTQTGQGLLITGEEYSHFRKAKSRDILFILKMMKAANTMGEFRMRQDEEIAKQIKDYWVFELDQKICASAALHVHKNDNLAEIGALVVDVNYRHLGIGKKMVHFLTKMASKQNVNQVVACTTRAVQFFREIGFEESTDQALPEFIRGRKSGNRKSRILLRKLNTK